jgi:DNA-directed RNA polymerase II subunit RPB1
MEMNLHMPQDVESDAELRNLAAVPYQIISPANNKPIIGIYQDSMLGCYRFTRNNVKFNPKQAMDLLMMFNKVNEKELLEKDVITSFDILSQILPPLTMKYKQGKDGSSYLEIRDGKYISGQINKDVVGAGTEGLIQRVCNDFGNMASADFIDNIQNIVTEYMKSSAFSVGISDLISNEKTNQEIISTITKKKQQVKTLIDQTQIGVFENETGKTNIEEFETQVNNILNQATSEAGKIGLDNLGKDNRFVIMVNAGSKGSDLNISQMISCLGQQNVDGKRIPYGFENRTLPHYTKFDDSPGARGFVESSYINGLSPQELFFHAMGGRVGLIDTAVKTSTTGYIQRRIIKALEDLMVSYDMTIRSNKNKIVQYSYGDDNIDTVKVENQFLPLVEMSIQEIYNHFDIPEEDSNKNKMLNTIFAKNTITRMKKQLSETKNAIKELTSFMVDSRDKIIKNVFKYKSDSKINSPVAFTHIINNVQGQQNINEHSIVDITPLEAYELIKDAYYNLEKIYYAPPTNLFKTLYYYFLSPKNLLFIKRFNRSALIVLLNTVALNYKKAIVAPGEMVGMTAGQSIGEVSTQMTLNTFHFAGVSAKSNVTRGVPRIEEILSLSSKPKNPSLTVYLRPEDEVDKDKVQSIMYMLEHTKLKEIVQSCEVCFDPDDMNTLIDEDKNTMEQYKEFENMIDECANTSLIEDTNEKSKWILRMVMDPAEMLDRNITMDDVNFTLLNSYGDEMSCIYSDYNSDKLVFRIRMNTVIKNSIKNSAKKPNTLDQSDHIWVLKNFQDQLLDNIILRGVVGINNVTIRRIKDNLVENAGTYKKQDIWVLDTTGTNLRDVLGLDYIDSRRTFSNDIIEVCDVLGIEAARQTILNELVDVIAFDGTYINYHHYSILSDRMTFTSNMISIYRHGINNDDTGPIAKASFEETPKMFLKAAKHAELETMRGISANVMVGQEGYYGTSAFQLILDLEEIKKQDEVTDYEKIDVSKKIEEVLGYSDNPNDPCSMNNLKIQNNVVNISASDLGDSKDYNLNF